MWSNKAGRPSTSYIIHQYYPIMTEFTLTEILNNSSSLSFNDHLKSKLQSSKDDDTDTTFNNVRCLFKTAAQALDLELKNQQDNGICNEDDIQSHCHWVPGRIEVMGKHTDYCYFWSRYGNGISVYS